MKFTRKLTYAAAVTLPFLALSAIGAGTATAGPAAITGTVTCTSVTGSISFTPALTSTGAGTETNEPVKLTVKGCTITGGTHKPKSGVITGNLKGSPDTCQSLLFGTSSQTIGLTTKWTPLSDKTSKTSFTGFNSVTDPSGTYMGDQGFQLPNTGGSGQTTGSYADSAPTATAYTNQTPATLGTLCGGAGVTKVTIVTGTATL